MTDLLNAKVDVINGESLIAPEAQVHRRYSGSVSATQCQANWFRRGAQATSPNWFRRFPTRPMWNECRCLWRLFPYWVGGTGQWAVSAKSQAIAIQTVNDEPEYKPRCRATGHGRLREFEVDASRQHHRGNECGVRRSSVLQSLVPTFRGVRYCQRRGIEADNSDVGLGIRLGLTASEATSTLTPNIAPCRVGQKMLPPICEWPRSLRVTEGISGSVWHRRYLWA